MKPDAVARAERILGTEAKNWARVVSRGYSVNEHWTVGFADGSRAFLKLASVDPGPQWVRDERRVFECVDGSFMPLLLGFEDGDRPLLILEDMLPDARWPPPWQPGDIDAVLAALNEVASAPLSGELPRLAEGAVSGWKDVAEDPAPFLGLRIVTAEWLERSLPALLEASDPALLDGGSLVHCDVRSDNLCLRGGRAVLLDWNHARVGNPAFDVAFWLPSLALEGGPDPATFGVDELAVFVAGFFAAQAGLPAPEGAPRVRSFQRAQLEVALPWACSALGLPIK
ncbi:MAG TPA: phosphotransferase [Gaiellaceae bacterium]